MLIALEGIDGSGKSTQAQILKDNLDSLGHKTLLTAEPTTGFYGANLRDIFAGHSQVDQHTIAAVFLADRLEHILHPEEGMLHLIAQGYTIITDRYYLSSYAYHGAHVDMDWVIDLNRKPASLLRPHLHIYLDMPPEQAMQRIQASREADDIELYETTQNLSKVYQAYNLAISRVADTERIRRVDATLSREQISEIIALEVDQVLAQ